MRGNVALEGKRGSRNRWEKDADWESVCLEENHLKYEPGLSLLIEIRQSVLFGL